MEKQTYTQRNYAVVIEDEVIVDTFRTFTAAEQGLPGLKIHKREKLKVVKLEDGELSITA